MKNIAIIGSGEFALAIRDLIEGLDRYRFKGFIGKEKSDCVQYYEADLRKLFEDDITYLANGVGNTGNSLLEKMIDKYRRKGFYFPKLFHPSAVISKNSRVDDGTVILENAVVKAYSSIGKFCVINSLAVVSHDCKVQDYVHISLGAKISGGCEIGKNSFLGINSSVIPGKRVGDNVIVGAGTVVVEDAPDNAVIVGNPGRIIRKKKKS